MPAIITDRFKTEILKNLQSDVDDSDTNYFVGIGRSIDWDSSDAAPTPLRNPLDVRRSQYDLMSIKQVAAHSFVVPRNVWTAGGEYSGYNDYTVGYPSNNFYVITGANAVYVCLEQGKESDGTGKKSLVEPTGSDDDPFKTSDGYVWKFLYSIGALRASQFLSAGYMPVTKFGATDENSPADHVEQKNIQDVAVPGEIVAYEVTQGGSGYSVGSPPTLTVEGDGNGARAVATVVGDAITKVEAVESDGSLVHGTGYNRASVKITGTGTGAKIRPIIGPKNGFGADPRDDLKASAYMFTAKPDGDEGAAWVTDNDFRQVSLVKNPLQPDSATPGTLFSGNVGNALRKLPIQSVVSTFSVDKTITGSSSQAKAYVVNVDSDYIWFTQNELTGFANFQEGEQITEDDGSGDGLLAAAGDDADSDAYVYGDINPHSGEIVFIDNRAAIDRSDDQTEDVKIIIQL